MGAESLAALQRGIASSWRFENRDEKRFLELDGLRGIAALGVLLYHYTTLFDRYFPDHQASPATFWIGQFGVQLFFLISGYVIFWTAHRSRGPLDFLVLRFSRLYPTYWAALAFGVLVVYATGFTELYRSAAELLTNVTMLQRLVGIRDFDGVYWSLSVEIVFYAFILIVMVISRNRIDGPWLTWLLWMWMGSGAAFVLWDAARPDFLSHLLVVACAGLYAPLFSVGLLLYKNSGRVTIDVIMAYALSVLLSWVDGGAAAGASVAALGLAFAAVVITRNIPVLRWRPLLWLGAISYPLYLVHQNMGYVVLARSEPVIGRLPAMALALCLALLVAWLIHRAVEVSISRRVRDRLRALVGGSQS